MTYSVYQPWDPLKVCVVGRSYPPEFYSWIKSPKLRNLFERIAVETEEDFSLIERKLQKFGVKTIRPNAPKFLDEQLITSANRIPGPVSMNPRDQMIMIGDRFFMYPFHSNAIKSSGRSLNLATWNSRVYDDIKGEDWPQNFTPFDQLPHWIQEEVRTIHTDVVVSKSGEDQFEISGKTGLFDWWGPILNEVRETGNQIITNVDDFNLDAIPANGITRIGRDLYFGIDNRPKTFEATKNIAKSHFPDYRCHYVTTGGHIDGCFTPVKPGLIVSILDIDTYEKTFPGWEVVYLKGEHWEKVSGFLELKKKNQGKWWIKGYEHDDEITEFVETWLRDWTGYVEESVFDVNILVIDEKNIIVNGYNKQAFDAFERHGITPHVCPIRHRYFWDGGIHCVTLDLHREGTMKDYFPERS